jgi:uncharacterized protein YjdB
MLRNTLSPVLAILLMTSALLVGCADGIVAPEHESAAFPVSEIVLNSDDLVLAPGDTVRLELTLLDSSGDPIVQRGNRPTTWSTSDPEVAIVDHEGLVTAIAGGSAIITAKSGPGQASADVRVKDGDASGAAVTDLQLTPDEVKLDAIGAEALLAVTATDENGEKVSDPSVTWTTSDPLVATVDSKGKVVSKAVGVALITAMTASVADTAVVHVTQVAHSLSISPESAELSEGETFQWEAELKDRKGTLIEGATIEWGSSDESIATVSSSGLVVGQGAGSTTITAFHNDLSSEATVYVAATSIDDDTEEGVSSGTCNDYSAARVINVSSTSELTSALRDARAGDLIQLAAGAYTGRWTISRSGTASSPIVLCGSRDAVLQDTRYDGGAVLTLKGVDHVVLRGFTVRTALWGIRVEGSNHNELVDLRVHDIGQEAIRIAKFSSDNVIRDSHIHDTGQRGGRYVEWSEGIYVGSWNGHWSDGEPDRSDRNKIINNVIGPNIGSEHIDIKEGTTGGVIRGNTFDGNGMGHYADYNNSWVIIHGNEYLIEGNVGFVSPEHGFKAVRETSGWGQNNVFRNNVADVQASGYGFYISTWTKGNVVECNNTVSNASSGYSNLTCSN